jgi:hypothetical protein
MVEEGAFRPQIKVDFIEDTLEDVPERGWEESRIVEKIPLPTHLPRKLDLSILPENVQKSGAIDSLIRQNEDLMARLNVSLRRHSILEEQAGKFENTLKQLQDRNEALADQVLVYREKDRLQGNSRKTSERQIQELKDQVSLLEIRYAEYYAVSREKLDYLSTKVERTTRRLARYKSYRTRINRLSKDRKKEAEQRIQRLDHENQKLTSRLQQETLSLSELRVKLGEAVDHIQRREVEYLDALVRGVYLKRDLPAGYELHHDSIDRDFYLAVPLQKGQLSCREIMNGQKITRDLKADDALKVDDLDSPYATNPALREMIHKRGL